MHTHTHTHTHTHAHTHMPQVLNELAELRGRVVLFIDDIHNLVPAAGGVRNGGSLFPETLPCWMKVDGG